MIKVLIVEDSQVIREFLVHILSSDPDIQVVGAARDGEEALELVGRERPDVITMDINMPRMNGFETTRRIMETNPTPIIIVSGSWNPQEVETTFQAIEAGALAMLSRPRGQSHPEFASTVKELIQTVKLMSEVKVVRRWPRPNGKPAGSMVPLEATPKATSEVCLVAIGASTGGPVALRTILTALSRNFPVPVVIVQHIAPGFVGGFADWLGQASEVPVHVAAAGQELLPGRAYLAPDGSHMGVGPDRRVVLIKGVGGNEICPSISHLFGSVAEVYRQQAVGVLLTGMGRDGADQLKTMRDAGAITIVQDKESSIVYGMPQAAINLDAACYIYPPKRIAEVLVSLVKKR